MSKYKPEQRESAITPPLKYGSRKVQVRLLLLVFMFMSVLAMMDRARDPKLYSWMGFESPDETEANSEDADLDTRLRLQPAHQSGGDAVRIATDSQVDTEVVERASTNPVGKVLLDAWATHLKQLSREDRWVMFRAFKHVRHSTKLSTADATAWPGVMAQLDVAWTQYINDARTSINAPESSMAEDEKDQWNELLDTIQVNWNEQAKPALENVVHEQTLTDQQKLLISRIESQINAVSLAQIRDDQVFLGKESDAWFRMLDELNERPQEDIEADSTGSPSYTGLFRQPDIYRGKLVTVRGIAKRADYVHAPKNAFDIKGYYLFWVQPTNGPKSPIAIYSLEIPDGFPVSDREDLDEYLNQEVAFTGFFFKRYAYRARDGVNTVPQLLAKSPRWTPQSPAPWTTGNTQLPGFLRSVPILWLFIGMGTAAAVVAVSVTIVAYQRSTWKNEAMLRAEGYSRSQVNRIEDVTKGVPLKDVKDKLNDLSKNMRDA